MINLIDLAHSEEWDDIIYAFAEHDVYYLSGYVKAFHIHGDGIPYLIYYEGNGLRAIFVYMRRGTDLLGVYDSVTPYGYGGTLFEGDNSEINRKHFWKEFIEKMKEEGIVDNFVRYHSLLGNAIPMKSLTTVIDLGRTVAMDLSSEQTIWDNLTSKNRNMIRKAEKNGVEIHHGKDLALFQDFKRIYNATMDKDNAEAYYYFEDSFYESIHRDLYDNYEMFYATYNGLIISMSIILHANGYMHYHLSGSLSEFRNLAPTNLLLYKAALWGCEQGFRLFHLGGGIGSGEDNLYKFKAAFNRHSNYQFSIGKEIFDQQKYDELVALRKAKDPQFNGQSNYFPLYRAAQ